MSRPELDAIDAALRGEGELAELVADVRASAPRMRPELALRLEEILVESAPPRRRLPAWLTPAIGAAAVGVVAVVVGVGALRSGSDERATSKGGGGGSSRAGRPASAAAPRRDGAGRPAPAVAVKPAGRGAVTLPALPAQTTAPAQRARRVERDVSL